MMWAEQIIWSERREVRRRRDETETNAKEEWLLKGRRAKEVEKARNCLQERSEEQKKWGLKMQNILGKRAKRRK